MSEVPSNYKGIIIWLPREDFELRPGPDGDSWIYYRNVPLWRSVSPSLDDYKFCLIDETMYFGGFVTLACQDDWGDFFHYGRWKSLEAAQAWLKNPRLL